MKNQTTIQTVTLKDSAHSVFASLQEAVVGCEAGVPGGDIEAIHDMRVASRRLRVALSNFAVCCDPDLRRLIRQHLSRLADVLGAIRDLDVMIESLNGQMKEWTPEQQLYANDLIRRLELRRKRRRKQLLAFLSGPEYDGLKADFLRLIHRNDFAVAAEREQMRG